MPEIQLIPTDPSHLDRFYEFESDEGAVWMAAFASLATNLQVFNAMWTRRIENPDVCAQTILAGGTIAGGILGYGQEGGRHIGYWIGREFWGQGVATEAVRQFLDLETSRPLFATCAADNAGSRKVLERNGFVFTHSELHQAQARMAPVEEVFFRLDP